MEKNMKHYNIEQTIKQYKVQRLEHSKKVPMNGQKNDLHKKRLLSKG